MDPWEAFVGLLISPFLVFAMGILFEMVGLIYIRLKPMGASGPFAESYNAIGTSLSISYDLFQLASSIETWIAVAVILVAVYGFFARLGGGRGGLHRR